MPALRITRMIARGCVALLLLVNVVISVPVSPGHMEEKDVKVMKCIVEVIADALSKPHPIPVSQDCLETLSTDDRLVSILRHRNFLRELQDIAAEGASERALKLPGDAPDHVTSLPKDLKKTADDQSMLVAMEKPEKETEKRGAGEESEETEQQSQKQNQIITEEDHSKEQEEEEEKNHISNSLNPEPKTDSQEETTIRDEERKHSSSENEENDPAHKEEGPTATDDVEVNPDVKQSIMEDNQEHKGDETEKTHSKEEPEEDEEEKKREVGVKRWSRVSKVSHKRVEMSPKVDERWESKHSKEREDPEGDLWRSPEEQELQLMAQTQTQDKREEEGSGSRKTGDAEIESLAAIESELESVAQKLHDLRRG
ncbi:chromogranin-A precursor [Danio rerio]|uniref:Chromogranin-A n=1 Tax=Danio rerio TaxID=7955 RepID=Q5RIJ8_DANRE|nr:chromogranin-A precursor [Danio rerio]|eukprot:NP_001006059.2 chromogranin-A precursor [Danio rerio]